MALTLSMRVGQDVFIREERVVVSWMESPFKFGLRLNDGKVVTITENDWTTVAPGVKVQAGIPRNQSSHSLVKLVFDAPGVPVVRGALYRKGPEAPTTCETCHGSKILHDTLHCPHCGGHGCARCTNGVIYREFKCPDCNDVSPHN